MTLKSTQVLNVADLSRVGDEFVDLPEGFHRRDFSGLPQNALERLIRRPKLSRYRAAWCAALTAKEGAIISHLPRMTAAVSNACHSLGRSAPHLAFSFNFTDLPVGSDLERFKRALPHVDRFCVYSEYERELYPEYFGLDVDRFVRVNWTQHIPSVSPISGARASGSYVSAIGGEGRDYAGLIEAAKMLPDIQFVIVARPGNVGPEIPGNVELRYNIPADEAWRIAVDSSVVVVPLKSRFTCCGHITIVSAELLGLPVISTVSEATKEYTADATLCEPGDTVALAGLIENAHRKWENFRADAEKRVPQKQRDYDRSQWTGIVSDFLLQMPVKG